MTIQDSILQGTFSLCFIVVAGSVDIFLPFMAAEITWKHESMWCSVTDLLISKTTPWSSSKGRAIYQTRRGMQMPLKEGSHTLSMSLFDPTRSPKPEVDTSIRSYFEDIVNLLWHDIYSLWVQVMGWRALEKVLAHFLVDCSLLAFGWQKHLPSYLSDNKKFLVLQEISLF